MKISLNCFSCSIGVQVESVDQKRGGESRVTNLVTQRQQLPVRLIRAESTFSVLLYWDVTETCKIGTVQKISYLEPMQSLQNFNLIHKEARIHFQIIFLRIRHFGGVPNMQVCVTSTEL